MVEGETGLVQGVGLTAVATAQDRKVESSRADALFSDLLAAKFVTAATEGMGDDHPLVWTRGTGVLGDFYPSMAGYLSLRTRLFDDRILDAVNAGCRQLVLLGAGLDARAYRLSWPEPFRLFEVDTPDVLSFKQRVIDSLDTSARCARSPVGCDLREDWAQALLAAGFDPRHPTVWAAEGLFVYLVAELGATVLNTVTALSPAGSRLIMEHAYPAALEDEVLAAGRQALEANRAGFASAVPDPVRWLADAGWQAELIDIEAFSAAYGRSVPSVVDSSRAGAPVFWIAVADRERV